MVWDHFGCHVLYTYCGYCLRDINSDQAISNIHNLVRSQLRLMPIPKMLPAPARALLRDSIWPYLSPHSMQEQKGTRCPGNNLAHPGRSFIARIAVNPLTNLSTAIPLFEDGSRIRIPAAVHFSCLWKVSWAVEIVGSTSAGVRSYPRPANGPDMFWFNQQPEIGWFRQLDTHFAVS